MKYEECQNALESAFLSCELDFWEVCLSLIIDGNL